MFSKIFMYAAAALLLTAFTNAQTTPPVFVADYDVWADAPACNTAGNTAWLNASEQKIIREINMVRTNPQRYLKYVQEYYALLHKPKAKPVMAVNTRYTYDSWGNQQILGHDTVWADVVENKQVQKEEKELMEAVEELMTVLAAARPLNVLYPSPCLTQAAREQGVYCKEIGNLTHSGRTGKEFDVRLKSFCGNIATGSECIAGGAASARQTVLMWLIDDGLATRNHRNILLDPQTKQIGIFQIGKVGDLSNSWVADFSE
jgi:uncharacterized protein YkwD